MADALDEHHGTVSTGGRINFSLEGEEQKVTNLLNRFDKTSSRYGIVISGKKTKLMANSIKPIEKKITVSGQELETVDQFKYLGAILSEEGSKDRNPSNRDANSKSYGKTETSVERPKQKISLSTKLKLLHA